MKSRWLNLFTILALLGSLLGTFASPVAAASDGPQATSASDAYLAKFDADLSQKAKAGGDEIIDLRIVVSEQNVDWRGLVQAVPRAQPDEASDLPVWYGRARARDLPKLASLPFVVAATYIQKIGPAPRFRDPDQPRPQITDAARARLQALRDNPPAAIASTQAPQGWWDVGPGHESKLAWAKGYTGQGVRVADIDSGVDFCHPDLQGTWATFDVTAARNYTYAGVDNYLDYFDGWPIALSPLSNYLLFFDLWYNEELTDLNTFAYGLSKFADTRATGEGDTIVFDTKTYTTTGTASAANPVYHIGYHPDTSLEPWWGERVAVLVVDETGDGVYETVYVDLNANHDFRDDDKANVTDPTACWDANGDGLADLSGGMVYFIADGVHWPQMMDWWFNPGAYFDPPAAGDLVAFMFDDPYGPAGAHGTLTAGNIVGQGVADGDPGRYGGEERPAWKPTGVGGMVQGGGKDAKLIAIGDIYLNFEASTEEAWYFATFGVDGYGDTDDGAHITSNSYGESDVDNDEWDNRSRLLTRLNTRPTYRGQPNIAGQHIAHLFSTGNGAPGYGTNAPPSGSTAIAVGASTQMGSTGWDSITGTDQIVWGDVIPWSNRGPTAVGHLAPSITADGAFAAGDLALNGAFVDGRAAWDTWGGTSRSCPVAAGNLALIYDAWKQRTGAWPTWQEARELLMNGAKDQMNDVLVQGAGAISADKSTDIAGGLYGLHIAPSAWYPGDYRGVEYPAFAQIIAPGGADSQQFTANNYSTVPITVTLTATHLTKISSNEFTVDAALANESDYDFNRPDYLFDVTQYAPGGIPAETDLMVAEVILPFDEFEPQGDNSNANNNNWRILWYSWKDVNGNGVLWNDANANGVVNGEVVDGKTTTSEMDKWEYVRFSYGYGAHTYRQVSVKDPHNPDRWKDGIFLGLQHRYRRDEVPVSHLTIRVTYYQKSLWPWITFDAPQVTVGANAQAAFTANIAVPADTPYGLYEGAIEVAIPEHGPHAAYTTIIPVVVNVAFTGDLTAAPLTLGGQPKAETRYDNSYVTGPMDWEWRPESGDWRFYFADQTAEPPAGSRLVVRDEWGDAAPETDIDTLVFGPTVGPYTRVQPPFGFNFGDFSVIDPATYGPYRLDVVGKSANALLGGGRWAFQTATGGNVEYVVAPLSEGLHEIVQHSVRYEGDKFEVPFTKTVSSLIGPSELTYRWYFTDTIRFSANITHSEGLTIEVYGLSASGDTIASTITQDPTPDDPCDIDAGGVYTYTTTLGPNVASFLAHVNVGTNDLDLYLLYDEGGDGFSCADVIASSTNSAGTDDEVAIAFPAPGDYMVAIQGWQVSPSPSDFSWYWEMETLDNTLRYRNADLAIGPGKDATFELYNVNPDACDALTGRCNDGILYVGFPDAPRLFSVPITVNDPFVIYLPILHR